MTLRIDQLGQFVENSGCLLIKCEVEYILKYIFIFTIAKFMETLLTKKTVSITELREPNKVIDQAGSEPVAILNRSNLVGYFVPVGAVKNFQFSICETEDVTRALNAVDENVVAVNDYLKDK